MASTQNKRDPFATLPLEVVQNICQHLDLSQLFRAQRVSPQWKSTISVQTVEASLRAWFRDEPPRSSANLSMKDLSNQAEFVGAFCTGKPFSMAIDT